MKKCFSIILLVTVLVSPVWAKHYPDSVMERSNAERRIEYGWNFEFYGGIGVSRYEFRQLGDNFQPDHADTRLGYPSWNVGLGINYYFVPWMGIGTGVEFNTYYNTAAVTRGWSYDGTDYQSDAFTYTATPQSVRERESLSMVEIPIAFKFRAMPAKVGFIGSLGVKLGLPVMNSYSLNSNSVITNSVNYPIYNVLFQNVPAVIEDAALTGVKGSYSNFRKLNYAAYAEAGILIQLSQRVDLALSAFANYYINDVATHSDAELSFAPYYTAGEYDAPFTGDFNGVLASTEVKQLHPWSAGLKVGIHINANRTRAQREYDKQIAEQEWVYNFDDEYVWPGPDTTTQVAEDTLPQPVQPVVEEQPQPVQEEEPMDRIRRIASDNNIDVCDMCEPQKVIVHDTVVQVVRQLDDMLSTSVIFFNLDDTKPILEPADILNRIAAVLCNNPDMKIHINGHACKLGYPAYNMRLAKRRAEVIASRLRAQGVRDDQMIIKSLGSKHPFRYNGLHTLSKDRRVEIIPENLGYPTETTEKVIPGSRLAQIARRHYGEPEYWVFIYEANRSKLSKNPDALPVGKELVIPDLGKRLNGMSKDEVLAEVARLKAEWKQTKNSKK